VCVFVVVVVWFPFCGDGCGGVAVLVCECVVVLVESFSVLFRCVLAFELTGCCAFFCWVVLLLVRLLARFHCVGVGFHRCGIFDLRTSCWPGICPLDWPCVMCFIVFTPLLMQVCVLAV